MSQALNRLRAMVSLPKYSRKCRGSRRATADGWRDRVEADLRRSRQVYDKRVYHSRSRWQTPLAIIGGALAIWRELLQATFCRGILRVGQ